MTNKKDRDWLTIEEGSEELAKSQHQREALWTGHFSTLSPNGGLPWKQFRKLETPGALAHAIADSEARCLHCRRPLDSTTNLCLRCEDEQRVYELLQEEREDRLSDYLGAEPEEQIKLGQAMLPQTEPKLCNYHNDDGTLCDQPSRYKRVRLCQKHYKQAQRRVEDKLHHRTPDRSAVGRFNAVRHEMAER